MSKSRKIHKWYDDHDDYEDTDRKIVNKYRDRRKMKKLKNAIKSKDLDRLEKFEE